MLFSLHNYDRVELVNEDITSKLRLYEWVADLVTPSLQCSKKPDRLTLYNWSSFLIVRQVLNYSIWFQLEKKVTRIKVWHTLAHRDSKSWLIQELIKCVCASYYPLWITYVLAYCLWELNLMAKRQDSNNGFGQVSTAPHCILVIPP